MDVTWYLKGLSSFLLTVNDEHFFHVLITSHLYIFFFFEKCLLNFFGCSYYFPNTCFFPLTVLTMWITFRLMFLKIPPDLYLLKNLQCFSLAMLVNFFKTGLRPFTVRLHMISL